MYCEQSIRNYALIFPFGWSNNFCLNITIKEIALQMWLDRKWVGKIVSLTPSITLWKTRKSFKEQCTQYCYYHNYFVFLLNYMIIAAYYLLLLFYEITKLQRYWLVNLGAFVKWTHRAQIFPLQLDIFNDFSASSSISTLNLVSCSSKSIILGIDKCMQIIRYIQIFRNTFENPWFKYYVNLIL